MNVAKTLVAGLLLLAAVVFVCPWNMWAQPAVTTDAQGRIIIDASKFPSLQEAFDAVPAGGGLVRLPPGDFRLTEPLVLERPETRVEGAGAATKLINCNQEGKPAPTDCTIYPFRDEGPVGMYFFRTVIDGIFSPPRLLFLRRSESRRWTRKLAK